MPVLFATDTMPRGVERLNEILSEEHPERVVAEMDVSELYFLIKELGLADSTELLQMATPHQVRGFLDFDGWRKDQLSLPGTVPWLQALCDLGFEKLTSVWAEIDAEWRGLVLASLVQVYDRTLEEELPEDEDRPTFVTPDNFFYLVITAEREEDQRLVNHFVDFLYRGDADLARHTIMAARSELKSYLEETSYRWRQGRMADLGYVDYYDALVVYSAPPSNLAASTGAGQTINQRTAAPGYLPTPFWEALVGKAFLVRALREVSDEPIAERLRAELVLLTNRVLSADRVEPGDELMVRQISQRAFATLAVGLEQASAGDVSRAAQLLRVTPLLHLFQLGYTLTAKLQGLAKALARKSSLAEQKSQEVLEGLLKSRPLFARVLENKAGERPIESLKDIRVLAYHLSSLTATIALAESLGAELTQPEEAESKRLPGLNDYAQTAMVRAMIGQDFSAAPLTNSEMSDFIRQSFDGGKLTEEARKLAQSAVLQHLEKQSLREGKELFPSLVDDWLNSLQDSFANLTLDQRLDPRFVGGVILLGDKI